MNDTEHLIRAALAKQAERAPHPGRILHALEKPRRRRPWLLAIIGACAVAAAVAIPVALSGNDPQPPAVIPPPPRPSDALPMKYMTTYLPDGMRENRRVSDDNGNLQTRHWGDGKTDHVTLANASGDRLEKFGGCQGRGVATDVNGLPARLVESPAGFPEVSWMINQDTCVLVTAGNEDEVLRIARSVRPDDEAYVRPLLRFGWLPPELTRKTAIISGETGGLVTGVLIAESDRKPGGPSLIASIHKKGTAPESNDSKTTTVDLGDGRVLRVDLSQAPPMAPEQKQHLVNGITVVEGVDLSWLGPN